MQGAALEALEHAIRLELWRGRKEDWRSPAGVRGRESICVPCTAATTPPQLKLSSSRKAVPHETVPVRASCRRSVSGVLAGVREGLRCLGWGVWRLVTSVLCCEGVLPNPRNTPV